MGTMTLHCLLLLSLHLVLAGPGPTVQLKVHERAADPTTDDVDDSNEPKNPGRPLNEEDFRRAALLPVPSQRNLTQVQNMLVMGEVEAKRHMEDPDLRYTMKFSTKNGIHALE